MFLQKKRVITKDKIERKTQKINNETQKKNHADCVIFHIMKVHPIDWLSFVSWVS